MKIARNLIRTYVGLYCLLAIQEKFKLTKLYVYVPELKKWKAPILFSKISFKAQKYGQEHKGLDHIIKDNNQIVICTPTSFIL